MGRSGPRVAGAAALLAVLLYGAEAHLNKIHYEQISLEEIVAGASLVVVARRADPATRETTISIVPKGAKPDPQKYPPFRRVKSRWVVEESMFDGRELLGKTIEVDGADWEDEL